MDQPFSVRLVGGVFPVFKYRKMLFSVCFFSPAWEMADIVETDEERRRYCFAGFQLPEHRFSCWKSLVTTIFELVSGFLTKKSWKNV